MARQTGYAVPHRSMRADSQERRGRGRQVGRRVGLAIVCLVAWSVMQAYSAPLAHADNCGSFSDCFSTIDVALLVLLGVLVLAVVAWFVLPELLAFEGMAAAVDTAFMEGAAEFEAEAAAELFEGVEAAEATEAVEAAEVGEPGEWAPADEGVSPPDANNFTEPGEWGPANENMSDRAWDYQEQITGHDPTDSYWVDDVKFDGYREADNTLLDAKGPGYEKFFDEAGNPEPWYRGVDRMINQATRQLAVAGDTPIEWHFAEEGAADAMRTLFQNAGLGDITVIWTPPLP